MLLFITESLNIKDSTHLVFNISDERSLDLRPPINHFLNFIY